VNNQNKYPYFAMFPSGSAPPADTTPPAVTATSPTANATDVPTSADVAATFSEPVTNVTTTTFTLTGGGAAVPATVGQGTGDQWILHPTAPLAAGTAYTATLTGGITDTTGNPLAGTSWSFTTAAPPADTAPPTVTTTNPTANAADVTTSTDVAATFSEPVTNVTTTTFTLTPAGGSAVPTTVGQGTGDQWILHPTAPLSAGTTYTATLTSGITDLANNAFAGTSWSFTTAAVAPPTDTTPPVWTGRIPSKDGATGVSRTANVTVAFNETVQNVTTETFTLTPTAGGPPVAASVTFSSSTGRWVLNPSATLTANTQYAATVSPGVTDLAGNAFAGMTWSFTTGA
jgi:nitrogen fixation protein FixH